jgi:RNA polymerase sigma-70 factor (ECF subfamily)
MTGAALEADAALAVIEQAQRGCHKAADRLVREHDGWVRGVIYGVTGRAGLVDDIAQQVWTQVWQRLGSLKNPRRLRSWLYTVARHAAIDAGQAARRRQTVGIDLVADPSGDPRWHDPVRVAGSDELHRQLLQAVESLPALYREPFVLRHLEEWSYAEIGETLGLPVETVETRLVRARRLLREALKGKVER